MGNSTEDDDSYTKPLGRWSVFYYGVGHMLNDITASCWFTYLLIFLTDIGLSSRYILDNHQHFQFNIYFDLHWCSFLFRNLMFAYSLC